MISSMPKQYLDAQDLTGWARRVVAELEARRTEINALNVFPVPDSDTGSNMAYTMAAALREVDKQGETSDVSAVAAALASGSVRGARGNSGVVLSQVLRGLAHCAMSGRIDGESIRQSLAAGYNFVVKAITEPVEGTVITVLRAASIAADQAETSLLIDVVSQAADAARVALAKTPSQLQALRDAGVVDAGGRGLVILLDALVAEVEGRARDFTPPPVAGSVDMFGSITGARVVGQEVSVGRVDRSFGQPEKLAEIVSHSASLPPAEKPAAGSGRDYLEVMFFIEHADLARVRSELQHLGDSFIVAELNAGTGHPTAATVHIHTRMAGKVIEKAFSLGQVSNLNLEVLPDRVEAEVFQGRCVVAVTPPGLLAQLYRDAGAHVVEFSGSDERDIVREVVATARATGRAEIIFLPNGMLTKFQLTSVERSSQAFEQSMTILATGSLVKGLASLSVHDPQQPLAVDAYAMLEVAAAMRTARVVPAGKAKLTQAGPCGKDDVLAVTESETLAVAESVGDAVVAACRSLLASGGEQVTIVVDESCADDVDCQWVRAGLPKHVDVVMYPATGLGVLAEIGVE